MSSKKYEVYKESGIKGVGAIPDHWEVKKLKYVLKLNPLKSNIKKKTDKEFNVTFIPMENIKGPGHVDYSLVRDIKDVRSGYTYFCDGDIIMAKVTPCFENRNISIVNNLENGIGFGSTELNVLRKIGNHNEEYFYYYLQSHPFIKEGKFNMQGVAGLKRVPSSFIENYYLPIPSIKEQEKISCFLKQKEKEINDSIKLKQQQIEILTQYRQSLITETVMRGLSSDVKLKDSGVKWIGEIPEHWEVSKIKYVKNAPMLYGATESGQPMQEGQARYIRITDLTLDGELKEDNVQSLEFKKAKPYMLKHDDILFARSGATVGKSFIYKKDYGPACFAGYLIKLSVDKTKVVPDFLYYYTKSNSYSAQVEEATTLATIQNVSAEKYLNFITTVPSIIDQEKIVEYLNQKTSQINRLIQTNHLQIESMQKYRQSLIYEAVTGKIDVRDYFSKEQAVTS